MTIILDSNLLLLLIVGSANPRYISKHKRLAAYAQSDLILLLNILARANKIIVTPNVLTETSNLAAQISDPARSHIYKMFRVVIADPKVNEIFVESHIAAARQEFLRLGLTDAALLHAGGEQAVLLTADLQLYLAALKDGLKATNFNHLRNL